MTRLFHAHKNSKCHKEAVRKTVQLPTAVPDVSEKLVSQLVEEKEKKGDMLQHILGCI